MEAEEYYYRTETSLIQQVDTINETISSLVITFLWDHGSAPTTNNVTPTVNISDGSITRTGISRSRSGSYSNYTYTITMTGVEITDALPASTVTISYSSGYYTYAKTVTVQELIDNPNVELEEQ